MRHFPPPIPAPRPSHKKPQMHERGEKRSFVEVGTLIDDKADDKQHASCSMTRSARCSGRWSMILADR